MDEKKKARENTFACSYLLFQILKNSNIDIDTRSGASFRGGFLCIDKYGYERSEFYPFVQ
jgi:hypothetical protein